MAGGVPTAVVAKRSFRASVLPGFGPTLGFTVFYLCLIVLIPLGMLVLRAAGVGPAVFWRTVTSPQAIAAIKLSFGGAAVAALVNAVAGLLVAWVLVRYRFPGKALLDALVDLPLALPTAVAGIALTAIYAPNGPIGQLFARFDVKIAFTWLGVVLAMVFVGIPFVVRTIQPVLLEIDPQIEEAAAVLGATRLQTFRRILLPSVVPPLITGATLAFARAVGEYGSIVFISGNLPGKTEILPFLIVSKLEQYDYDGAIALAVLMLIGSFALLFAVNALQAWNRRVRGGRRA
jgi:sulfate transport system permease protein